MTKAKPKTEGASQYVTKAEFEDFGKSLLDLIENKMTTPVATTPEAKEAVKEVKAGHVNQSSFNPVWDEHAKEIIGSAVDHTEEEHTESGARIFTVYIKPEMSNAPKFMLQQTHNIDRRSKEVSVEGLQGVIQWCKQIKANLAGAPASK